MSNEVLAIGNKVVNSPIGAGRITGMTLADYPKVNDVAVAWLVLEDGRVFDPHSALEKGGRNEH